MVGSSGESNPVSGDDGDYRRVATFRFWYDDARWEWSPEAAVLHGYAPGTVTPTTELLAQHKHPEDRESFLALVEDMRTEHTPFSSRHRIIDVQGRTHPVAVIAHTFRDDSGEVVGTEGFYLDLAEFTNDTVLAEVDDHIKAFRESSAVIEQAKGMIMVIYGVTADRAFDVLTWRSQTENRKLRAICEAIVADAAQVQITEPIRHQFDRIVLSAATPPRS
ncbi:PAS and ANTAR domain-containing protein [Gordonia lacunae]|uniref:PAS and ANTAR domain-containing protein n=1 Tax=Gordonia lacunae TaxID=417102 RepID=UPI0039E49395